MIAVFSASALAIGVIVTSLTTGMTTDVDSYMFGSILAMSRSDVILSVTLALCVLALYILFYHKLFPSRSTSPLPARRACASARTRRSCPF